MVSVVSVLSASAPSSVRERWITVRRGKAGSFEGVRSSCRARVRVEARKALRSVWASLWEMSPWRVESVAGLRSKGGMGSGWKRGARKERTSDQARESEAACFALEGERSGSGSGSIKQLREASALPLRLCSNGEGRKCRNKVYRKDGWDEVRTR